MVIENPIINSLFSEPNRYFYFSEAGITDEVVNSRRLSAYFIPEFKNERFLMPKMTP